MTLASLPPTRPPGAASFPGKEWAPPAQRLPGPHGHVRLVGRLGRTAGRDVWAGEAVGRGGEPLVVELLNEEPSSGVAKGSRWVLDLRPWAAEGWPAAAVVTSLPASLPDPYPRFQLLSFIGLGGMGQVWMAEAPDYPDLPLAIKFFTHPVYRQHPALLEQCLQEATVGIGIDSPVVARTYQLLDLRAHQAQGWPPIALVMRLYEPSLQRVLEDCRTTHKRLPLPQVAGFARNLLDALDVLHSGHGLVHRDVKPSNVLLRLADDRPYRGPESLEGATALLSDLGTLCRSGQRPVFALGQDGWKAPELFAHGSTIPDGERPADPAEDLYAFGLVLRSLVEAAEPDSAVSVPCTMATLAETGSAAGGSGWLRAVADELTADEPLQRLTAKAGLRGQLSGPARTRRGGSDLPSRFGPYQLLDRIGVGGMGEVYKAQDTRLCRLIALKVIRGLGSCGGEGHERFRREAMAVGRLNHPNIVQIHDVGEAEGRPFFALELVAGGSLADRIRGGPLPPGEAARVVRTLAEAMHFAHERGIIHRDLKPSNVLMTAEGVLKIADFGLAKHLAQESALTQSGAVMGTPAYMSPEQAAGDIRAIGPPADVYALGAILYDCLTGRPPFRGGAAAQTLMQVLRHEVVPPSRLNPRVPRDLETICLKCLEKDPQRRYPSARDLADDLDRFLKADPIQARPARTWERASRFLRRHPAAVLALVLGLLLAGMTVWNAMLRWRLAVIEHNVRDQDNGRPEGRPGSGAAP